MNKAQEYIVQILNHSIHNKKIELDTNEDISWKDILEECKSHNIESLVYYGINSNTLKTIDKEILEYWKKQTFMSNVYQINHIKQISNILSIFNDKNIPIIVLKGLVIRDLYPKSELRTMGDADILIHEKDIETVIEILDNRGYKEEDRDTYHIEFGKGNSHIEVHWSLTNEGMFNEIDEFNNEIWLNAVEVKIGASKALSMCDEDLLVYLCIHMAKHFINSGFGIRQVCDVLLLVEQRSKFIDWNRFMIKAKRSGIDKFTMSIFAICNKLFEMSIPDELEKYKVRDEKNITLIVDDIFANGVHGYRDKMSTKIKQLTYENNKKKVSYISSFRRLYFPSSDNLCEKYGYAKKYKLLLPVAWIHRFVNTIFRKDYSVSDKIKLSMQGANISKKHSELLSWLEL